MKRAGYLIEQVADMDNLMQAFYLAQRGKSLKAEVKRYRDHLQDYLSEMRYRLLMGNVQVGDYNTFYIHDPKKRQICAASFDERVLHQALMRVCHSHFERQLISDTYATRKGKGTYKAIARAHEAMKCYRFVAKMDVRKYFDSIDHSVLKAQLLRMFKDGLLIDALFKIIDSYQTTEDKGLPIGNLTSQYYANHYLSSLDHFAKEELRVPVYVRYMDDVLLFGNDRGVLQKQVSAIEKYAREELRLFFKAPIVSRSVQGVSFLGYRLHGNVIGLNSRSRNRFCNKIHKYQSLLESGIWTEEEYRRHVVPLLAFTQHAYSKRYRRKLIEKVENRRALTVSTGVAAGTTTRGTAACRTATTTTPRTATTTSASALCCARSLQSVDGFP